MSGFLGILSLFTFATGDFFGFLTCLFSSFGLKSFLLGEIGSFLSDTTGLFCFKTFFLCLSLSFRCRT